MDLNTIGKVPDGRVQDALLGVCAYVKKLEERLKKLEDEFEEGLCLEMEVEEEE